MTDLTIAEIDNLSNTMVDLKQKIEKLDEEASGYREKFKNCERRLIAYLEQTGKDSWQSSRGDLTIRERTSVKVPRTPDDKRALFDWLTKRGIFYEACSVNSNTLNALYRTEFEIACREGRDFSMPGVGSPEIFRQIIVKAKK